MTAREMKIKVFSLIEEYYPDKTTLADDEDIKNKINGAINQIQLDLMSYKKIPAKYVYTIETKEDKVLLLSNISEFYQLNQIDTLYDIKGDYEIVFDIDEKELPLDIDIYYYKYPSLMEIEFKADGNKTAEELSAEYDLTYEFELAPDVLEIMPYGIAADLLKTDMISNYGSYFYDRYLEMRNNIDSRKASSSINIVGGVDI